MANSLKEFVGKFGRVTKLMSATPTSDGEARKILSAPLNLSQQNPNNFYFDF